jgi:hypothetical protein
MREVHRRHVCSKAPGLKVQDGISDEPVSEVEDLRMGVIKEGLPGQI